MAVSSCVLAAGYAHSLLLGRASLTSWGSAASGCLGQGPPNTSSAQPSQVPTKIDWLDVTLPPPRFPSSRPCQGCVWRRWLLGSSTALLSPRLESTLGATIGSVSWVLARPWREAQPRDWFQVWVELLAWHAGSSTAWPGTQRAG